ncbi:Leucine Rich Repeat [Seminavis robusta]|uniref:Leucine Rich Repeat n=1 Tax=Seminavis robusta TaxID=568900 RepID=A0A9N8E6W7_9STRA|nr:Leucine Rich Repeat [Seminavis robusta]|eukprot:Sro686_g187110.1 Leucine Rich Repeat (732) ;mRNA; r:35712-37998
MDEVGEEAVTEEDPASERYHNTTMPSTEGPVGPSQAEDKLDQAKVIQSVQVAPHYKPKDVSDFNEESTRSNTRGSSQFSLSDHDTLTTQPTPSPASVIPGAVIPGALTVAGMDFNFSAKAEEKLARANVIQTVQSMAPGDLPSASDSTKVKSNNTKGSSHFLSLLPDNGIAATPEPVEQPRPRAAATPGAVFVAGIDFVSINTEDDASWTARSSCPAENVPSSSHNPIAQGGDVDEGLVAAYAVPSDHLSNLELAIPVQNPTTHLNRVREEADGDKQKNVVIIGSVVCLLVMIGIAVAAWVSSTGQSSTPHESNNASQSISPTTMAPSGYVIDLPNLTMAIIEAYPDSNQALAYNWLLNDPNLTDYTPQRLQQRYALVTIYYAMGGEQWKLSSFAEAAIEAHDPNECQEWGEYDEGRRPPFFGCECWSKEKEDEGGPKTEPMGNQSSTMSLGSTLGPPTEAMGNQSTPASAQGSEWISPEDAALGPPLEGTGNQSALAAPLPLGPPAPMDFINNGTILQSIFMPKRGLEGSIPPELALLTTLEAIHWSRNDLKSYIPSSIFLELTNLKQLDLGHTMLSGTIPPTIGSLSNLIMLDFGYTTLSGKLPSELGRLTNLELFFVDESPLISGPIPSELGLLPNLRYLDLNGTDVSGPMPEEVCDLKRNGSLIGLVVNCTLISCPSTCGCDCANGPQFPIPYQGYEVQHCGAPKFPDGSPVPPPPRGFGFAPPGPP